MDYVERIPQRGGMNPLVTGLAGMVIGAGVATAASMLWSDKKTRDRFFHTISDIRDKAWHSLENAKMAAMEKGKEVREIAEHRLSRRRIRRAA